MLKNIIRVAIPAGGLALAATALPAAAEPVAAVYAQGRNSCVLTHEVSVQAGKPGHATLTVKPRIGFSAGGIGAECESTLPVRWDGGAASFIVKSPGQIGEKPQTFDLATGSGNREITVGEGGAFGPATSAKLTARVP